MNDAVQDERRNQGSRQGNEDVPRLVQQILARIQASESIKDAMSAALRPASLSNVPIRTTAGTTTISATIATVAAADMPAERTALRILVSRGAKRTARVSDPTIAGMNGMASR
jgi:hypothetical protein